MSQRDRRKRDAASAREEDFFAVVTAELTLKMSATNHATARHILNDPLNARDKITITSIDAIERILEGPRSVAEQAKFEAMVEAELDSTVAPKVGSIIPEGTETENIHAMIVRAYHDLHFADLQGLATAARKLARKSTLHGSREFAKLLKGALAFRNAYWDYVAGLPTEGYSEDFWLELDRLFHMR